MSTASYATTYRAASEYPLDELVDALNRGFEGYIVNVSFGLPALLSMLTRDSVDLGLSTVAEVNGSPAAIGLIAKRGKTVRLAAMGVASHLRGQGIGKGLMEHFLGILPSQGYQRFILEVIEQNPAAVNLYKRVGFEIGRRLISLQFDATNSAMHSNGPAAASPLVEIDPATLATKLTADQLEDLPWQLSGPSIMMDGPPNCAFSTEHGIILLTDPGQSAVTIRSIFVDPSRRGVGVATEMVAAVLANFPGKKWMVPALCPEELAPVFLKNGFTLQELSQFQMSRSL